MYAKKTYQKSAKKGGNLFISLYITGVSILKDAKSFQEQFLESGASLHVTSPRRNKSLPVRLAGFYPAFFFKSIDLIFSRRYCARRLRRCRRPR